MRQRLLHLEVGGCALHAFYATGRIAVGELFAFEAHAFAETEPPAISDLLGKPFTLTIHSTFGDSLEVNGVCMAVESVVAAEGSHFVLDLAPEVAPLDVGQDSYVFQEMTVVDIVKDVLASSGIEHVEWRVASAYAKRKYTAQYRESDWAFIERLCADAGIYYWFDTAAGATTLVFADDSTSAPEIEGGAELVFRDESAMLSSKDCVTRVKATTRIAPSRARLTDYDDAKPKLLLDGKASDGAGEREVYDYPGHFDAPAAGDARAKLLLQSLRAERRTLSGTSGSLRLRSGHRFHLAEHPNDALNAGYFCRWVTYEARYAGHDAEGEQDGLHTEWCAIPSPTPYRLPRRETVRHAGGPQTGIVCGPPGEEIHTDAHGKIRVQFYWDRSGKKDDKASTPMRVGQLPLGGSMILPRVGWDLLVEHHEGEIDRPFIVSHLYEGLNKVPYALPANKTRSAWQTATTPGGGTANEIRYEDKAGSEEVFINASKDMKVTVGDSAEEKVGANHACQIGANQDITIGSNDKLTVGADQTVSIGAAERLTVSGNRSVDVTGSVSATIGASRTLTAIKGHTLDADGGRTLTVGGSMMSMAALGVSRMTLGSYAVTVGGAWMSLAATGLANTTVGACAETVGGAKIQAGGGGIQLNTKGAAAETVGGAYIIAAGANVSETSDGTLAITVGGAFLATTPEISMEAESEILIQVGATSLTIKPGSIELKSVAIPLLAGSIDAQGSAIHHNP